MEKLPSYCNLIPELVSLTGMTDEQKNNHGTMKEVAEHTKLAPKNKTQECEKIKKELNSDDGLIAIGNPLEANGYVMPAPIVELKTR